MTTPYRLRFKRAPLRARLMAFLRRITLRPRLRMDGDLFLDHPLFGGRGLALYMERWSWRRWRWERAERVW